MRTTVNQAGEEVVGYIREREKERDNSAWLIDYSTKSNVGEHGLVLKFDVISYIFSDIIIILLKETNDQLWT